LRADDNSPLELTGNIFEDTKIMAVKVRIPTPLRKLTNDAEVVEVSAKTVGDAITELQGQFPGIQERLVDEAGAVRRFVNVYVNEEDIRFLQNQQTPLKDGDEVSIIPAIAGG
jgi:sulfur-carrier protein